MCYLKKDKFSALGECLLVSRVLGTENNGSTVDHTGLGLVTKCPAQCWTHGVSADWAKIGTEKILRAREEGLVLVSCVLRVEGRRENYLLPTPQPLVIWVLKEPEMG